MFPDLVDIGFLHLKTYGACMAAGFLLCWRLVEKLSGRGDLSNFVMALMVAGVVGSRAAYVIEHWRTEFASNPAAVFRVDQGGLMFYGGFLLAAAVFFAWCRLRRESPVALGDLFCAVVPLGHACGRVGCFFYGCCYGRDSDAWCAVTFPPGSPSWAEHGRRLVSVLPTQLFEAAALLALFAALMWLWRRKDRVPGLIIGVYAAGYAVIRFGIEYLRGDPRAAVGPFSISQTISIAMLVTGAAFIEFARHHRRG
ncbi:MAG: prolipoprotein diacylglyceryl transferase [Kiritimatiellae bacterium]|nr:prolipoprotein diacylglyceryl transferase [Kiritimatiellia bacterium]